MKGKKKFVISMFPEGMFGSFLNGPFNSIKEATNQIGDEGKYIFVLEIDRVARVIRWWDDATDEWKGFIK